MSVEPQPAPADKALRVREMFARIARRYDLNNRLHSFWRDQAWRRSAVRVAAVQPGQAVLDVACGTGDLAGMFDRTGAGRVVGLDFCEEMLELARLKFAGRRIEWVRGDAMELPFADGSFDVVSIAFGIRNVSQPRRALEEFVRVLRPGGRLVVLEFDRPRGRVLGAAARFYLDQVMPRTAAWLAGDREGAYAYLRDSVKAFWTAEELAGEMVRSRLSDVVSRRLTLGIAALHRGVRP